MGYHMPKRGGGMKRRWLIILAAGLGALIAGCDLVTPPVLPPVSAPADLRASVGEERDQIVLRWTAVDRAERYEIVRSETQDGEYQRVGKTSTTSFSDPVDQQGKWFWYKVRACNAAGCGPFSQPVRGYAGRPPKPENVQASDGDYRDKIVITWDAVPGATYYQVFRDPSPVPGCQGFCYLGEAQTNYFEDTSANVGIRYRYVVRACNDHGCSEQSAEDYGCIAPCPTLFASDEG